jgi:excisionase family DNA binding protein
MAKQGAQVLTADEAARYLRLHVKSIYRLVRAGKIPGQKVGGTWRFHAEALEKWLKHDKVSS